MAWMWTMAFGFFSTAYTRMGLPARTLACMAARTRGPLPAPTTINTCAGRTHELVLEVPSTRDIFLSVRHPPPSMIVQFRLVWNTACA